MAQSLNTETFDNFEILIQQMIIQYQKMTNKKKLGFSSIILLPLILTNVFLIHTVDSAKIDLATQAPSSQQNYPVDFQQFTEQKQSLLSNKKESFIYDQGKQDHFSNSHQTNNFNQEEVSSSNNYEIAEYTPRLLQGRTIDLQFRPLGLFNELPTTFSFEQEITVSGVLIDELSDNYNPQNSLIILTFKGNTSTFRCSGMVRNNKQFDFKCKMLRSGQFKVHFETGGQKITSEILRVVLPKSETLREETDLIISGGSESQKSGPIVEKQITTEIINGITIQTTTTTTRTPSSTKVQTSKRIIPTSSRLNQISQASDANPQNRFLRIQIPQSSEQTLESSTIIQNPLEVQGSQFQQQLTNTNTEKRMIPPQNPSISQSSNFRNLKLVVRQFQLFVEWSPINAISTTKVNITFTQGKKRIEFSQFLLKGSYKIDPLDFVEFQENKEAELHFSLVGKSEKITKKFLAVENKHQQVRYQDEKKFLRPIPNQAQVGQSVIFQGRFPGTMGNQILLETPSSNFIEVKLVQSIDSDDFVPPNRNFRVPVKFEEEGVYLIEINRSTGRAIINQPIYIGQAYPLVPDYRDLVLLARRTRKPPLFYFQSYLNMKLGENFQQPPSNSPISERIQYLLDLTNSLRRKFGVGTLSIDTKLNRLSQLHAQDMIRTGVFGHVNAAGETPFDRAEKMGIKRSIGENLASAFSLTEAFLMLWRSAAHLRNSVKEDWDNVGIGIAKNQKGMDFVVFNFGVRNIMEQPLTPVEINGYKTQLIEMVMQQNPKLEAHDPLVSRIIENWMKSGRKGNIFSMVLSQTNYKGFSASSWDLTYRPNFIQQFQNSERFPSGMTQFNKFGVGVGFNNQKIEIYFVFLV